MRTQTGERQMLTPSTNSLIRGALQTTLALLAAASCGGWFVLLAMFVGVNVDMTVIFAAFWALTVLYGLLALGSALATIGLTVPVIAGLALYFGWTLELGLDAKGTTLLALMLLIASMSLGTGRTTVLQGSVHLVIFAVFLFTAFFP